MVRHANKKVNEKIKINLLLSYTMTFANYYFTGLLYNLGRTFYYNGKTQTTTTWYEDTKRIQKEHPLLFKDRMEKYFLTLPFSLIWPFIALDDIDFYQKRKMGIKIYPPAPYTSTTFKD